MGQNLSGMIGALAHAAGGRGCFSEQTESCRERELVLARGRKLIAMARLSSLYFLLTLK